MEDSVLSVHSVASWCYPVFFHVSSSYLTFLVRMSLPWNVRTCRGWTATEVSPNMWLSTGTQIRSQNKIPDSLNTCDVLCCQYSWWLRAQNSLASRVRWTKRQRTSDVSLSPLFLLPVSQSLFHEAGHRTWKYHSPTLYFFVRTGHKELLWPIY